MRCAPLVLLGIFFEQPASHAQSPTHWSLGGYSAARYVFSGTEEKNLFFEGQTHDVRFELAALSAVRHEWGTGEWTMAARAGAVIAAKNKDFRAPMAALNTEHVWRATRRLMLREQLDVALEPISSSRAPNASRSLTDGRNTLAIDPAIEVQSALSQIDTLSILLEGQLFFWLHDRNVLFDEEVVRGLSAMLQLDWTRYVTPLHQSLLRGFVRVMSATTGKQPAVAGAPMILPPTTAFAGVVVGDQWEFSPRGQLSWRIGAGRVFNLNPSPLWAIEPIAALDLSWQFSRFNKLYLESGWQVRENNYVGGMPERVIFGRARWDQLPSASPIYGGASLGYELSHYGTSYRNLDERNRWHVVRAQGRVVWRIANYIRLFAEAGAVLGWQRLFDQTDCTVADGACRDRGVNLSVLMGVAILHAPRPQEEQLLSGVW